MNFAHEVKWSLHVFESPIRENRAETLRSVGNIDAIKQRCLVKIGVIKDSGFRVDAH